MLLKPMHDRSELALEETLLRSLGPWASLARRARIALDDATGSCAQRAGPSHVGFQLGGSVERDVLEARYGVPQTRWILGRHTTATGGGLGGKSRRSR